MYVGSSWDLGGYGLGPKFSVEVYCFQVKICRLRISRATVVSVEAGEHVGAIGFLV